MRHLLVIATLFAGTLFLVSCGEDDTPVTFDDPTVEAPTAGNVDNGSTGNTVDFTVSTDVDLTATYTVETSTNVTATNTSGDVDGTTVTVTFDASTTAGAAFVTLTITDSNGGTANATAVFAVNEVGDDAVSISGIPATGTVEAEVAIATVTATISMGDVPGTLNITKNGEAFGSEIAITTDGQTVDFDYTPSIDEANTNVTFQFTAADSDDDTDVVTHVLEVTAPTFETVIVDTNIESNTTWETGKVYELAGRITVVSGVTLTIEEGVIVKGQAGAETNSKALVIARGGTLNASGTATAPIIFTSTDDNIIPGQINSPNLESNIAGLWGGVIILGNAQISASNDNDEDVTEAQIEGIPTSDSNGLYGGSANDDNSGTISYISIRHGGTDIGSGNEINGLTLGGVGSGTSISNVEVVANNDDGIEWFGGNVSVSNVVIWNSGDDGLDTDQDWIGTCDNFLIVTPLGGSAFELDGPEGSLNRGFNTFTNGTVYAGSDIDHLVDWDGSTNTALTNIYFYGLAADYGFIEDEDPEEAGNQNFNPIESFGGDASGTSSAWEYTLATGGADAAEIFAGVTITITEVAANANTVGGPAASTLEWTWAAASGALADIGL